MLSSPTFSFEVWQLVVLIVHFFLGGRTAWSSSVKLQGRTFAARYWYDGVFVNNAREDAAEVALFILDPENHQARATTTYPGQLWPQQNASFQQQRSYWSVSLLREAIFVCFIFFFFLLFLFGKPNCLTFFFPFLFSFFFPPFFTLSFSFNCIQHIPGQYQYHAGPQLYVQRIGPVVGSSHCTRRHATSGDALFRWPASSSGFDLGRCLSCILPVADPFLFSFIPFLVSPRFKPPKWEGPLVYLCFFPWHDNWNRNYVLTKRWHDYMTTNKPWPAFWYYIRMDIWRFDSFVFFLFSSLHFSVIWSIEVIPEARRSDRHFRHGQRESKGGGMRCNWISLLGGEEYGVFIFLFISPLSLSLSSPPEKSQYAISFRAMHYYTWIRI